mmetsp:Transcript_114550/g.208381  ORF Transcript_114550/g.208381 Transcript_114550/m.208381 type:complete len:228 (+) Transcript_114550:441-1124(+)
MSLPHARCGVIRSAGARALAKPACRLPCSDLGTGIERPFWTPLHAGTPIKLVLEQLNAQYTEDHQEEQMYQQHVQDRRRGINDAVDHHLQSLTSRHHSKRPQGTNCSECLHPSEGVLISHAQVHHGGDDYEQVKDVPTIPQVAMLAADEAVDQDLHDSFEREERREHAVHDVEDVLYVRVLLRRLVQSQADCAGCYKTVDQVVKEWMGHDLVELLAKPIFRAQDEER